MKPVPMAQYALFVVAVMALLAFNVWIDRDQRLDIEDLQRRLDRVEAKR